MGGRTAVGAACAVWAGLVVGAPRTGICLVALALAVALTWLALRAPPRVGRLAMLLALGGAAMARGGASRLAYDVTRVALPSDGAIVRLRIAIAEPPLRESGEPVARVRVIAATPRLPRDARLRLRLPEHSTLEAGDRADVVARLDRLSSVRNPGGFDGLAAGRSAAVVAHGRVFVSRACEPTLARRWQRLLEPGRVVNHARRAIELAYARTLDPGARELVTPLVVGDRSGMSPEADARLRSAGLVHLLALSGLHVVWFAGLVRALGALVGAGRRTRTILGAASALGYAALAGPLPSLLRAVAGECANAAAAIAGCALDPLQCLGLSALALLIASPGWAHDLGFQLSCAATLGLITLAPAFVRRLPPHGLARALFAPLALTAAAQLVTLPLLIVRFHALPWAGLLANLVAVPVAEWLLAGGVLLAASECLAPGSGHAWGSACELLAWALHWIAAAASRLPGSQLAAGHEPLLPGLIALGVACLIVAALAPRPLGARERGRSLVRDWSALLGATLVSTSVLAALTVRPLLPPAGHWWLVALDVGQGDAIALGFPDGWWLVDAGPRNPHGDAGESAVLPFLRWAGIRRLDALLLTHDDGDHVGGAPAVRRGVHVARTLVPAPRPGVPGPLARFSDAHGSASGDVLRAGEPIVRVRWPPEPSHDTARVASRGDNASSLTIELGEGRTRALLSGDADSVVEGRLRVEPGLGLLKAGHHGSASSSGASFLARARPRWVLVSAGRRNPYGHPTPAALARFEAIRAAVVRTDHSGAVWFEFGGDSLWRVDWRASEPGAVTPLPCTPGSARR